MAKTRKTKKIRTPGNQPGRPVGNDPDQVRAALLEAARSHFLKREFKAVSVREIASEAGVNAAMVNYYFGNKLGLYEAMVDQLLERLTASMAQLDNDELTVEDFFRSYSQLLADNPWWPNFIVREVLFGDGAMRESIVRRFASGFAPKLLHSLQKEIDSGHYRSDLDPRLTLVSLMSMTVFPFLAKPILKSVMGLEVDSGFVDILAGHNIDLFLRGAEAPGGTS